MHWLVIELVFWLLLNKIILYIMIYFMVKPLGSIIGQNIVTVKFSQTTKICNLSRGITGKKRYTARGSEKEKAGVKLAVLPSRGDSERSFHCLSNALSPFSCALLLCKMIVSEDCAADSSTINDCAKCEVCGII